MGELRAATGGSRDSTVNELCREVVGDLLLADDTFVIERTASRLLMTPAVEGLVVLCEALGDQRCDDETALILAQAVENAYQLSSGEGVKTFLDDLEVPLAGAGSGSRGAAQLKEWIRSNSLGLDRKHS